MWACGKLAQVIKLTVDGSLERTFPSAKTASAMVWLQWFIIAAHGKHIPGKVTKL